MESSARHYSFEMATAPTEDVEDRGCVSAPGSSKKSGVPLLDTRGCGGENCIVTLESESGLTVTRVGAEVGGSLADVNNNNPRNKVFSVQTLDRNCSQTATPVAQQLVQGGGNEQLPLQQQQNLLAVPVHAGGATRGNANMPATQEVNFSTHPSYSQTYYAQQQNYAQQGYPSQTGFQQPATPYATGGYSQQQIGYPQGVYYSQNYGYPQGSFPVGQGYPAPPPQAVYGGGQGHRYQQGYGEPQVIIIHTKLETPEERIKFIRGVYTILVLQLTVLFGFVLLCTFHEGVQSVVRNGAVLIVAMIIYICCSFALCCFAEKMMSTNPFSIGVLIVLTLSLSLLVGFITSTVPPNVVLLAIGVTLLVTLGLTVVACTCSYDFTQLMPIMFIIVIFLILFGIAAAFLGQYMPILHIIYAYAGAIIFSVYIIIDTQMLMSGKKYSLSSDMVIFGAINLFVDIVNLFLYMLQILNEHD